jgi:hypothetical protein
VCYRDDGLLITADGIANKTLFQVWKKLWRENGLGAFALFDVEIGYQE